MSAILDKLAVVKQDAIAAEGWMAVHKNWFIACAVCIAVGVYLGHRFW